MAYLFVPFPVSLDDLEGHSPNAMDLSMQFDEHLCDISTVLTVTARRISPCR